MKLRSPGGTSEKDYPHPNGCFANERKTKPSRNTDGRWFLVTERVSVLICAYNYARFLPQCLASVIGQTRPPEEIIVVDDGSRDNTAEAVKQFPEVRYIYQENAGKAAAFNRALAASSGEVVCHLDADDCWEPGKLERVLPYFDADPTLGGVIHEVTTMDGDGNSIPLPWSLDHPDKPVALELKELEDMGFVYPLPRARGRWFGVPNTACVRRETVEDLVPLPRSVGLSVDGIYALGAIRRRIVYLPDALARYRIHGRNSSFGDPVTSRDTIGMWEFLLDNDNYRRHLSRKCANLLRAAILERKGYVASRTGENILDGAWASAQVPLILLRNGVLCNWKQAALPMLCLLPVKRIRPKPPHKNSVFPATDTGSLLERAPRS